MDKNNIRLKLQTFLGEGDKSPVGKTETEKVQRQEKTVNNDYYKEVSKKMGEYDSASKSDKDSVKKGDLEKTSSEDTKDVNFNGMDQIKFDNEPTDRFKQRAKDALVGSSKMGNKTYTGKWNPETGEGNGNTEEVWGASGGKHTGEEILKSAVGNSKKDAVQQEDAVAYVPQGKVKTKLATENTRKKNPNINESHQGLGDGYTHFAVFKSDGKIADGWDYTDLYDKDEKSFDNQSIKDYSNQDIKDNFPNNKPSDFKLVTRKSLEKNGIDPSDTTNWFKSEANETKNSNEIIKENKMDKIKRLRFEKPFHGLGKALTLIPESYKTDNKIFEMTDGNEHYRIRWEGDVNEGQAVVLKASDKKLMNEDIVHMKHLMGFKAETTLGTPNAKERVSENNTFRDMMNLTSQLLEGEEKGDRKPITESAFAGFGFTQESEEATETKEVVESEEEVTESKGEKPTGGGESTKIGATADGVVRGAGHDKHVMESETEDDEMLEGFENPTTYSVDEATETMTAGNDLGTDIGKTAAGDPRGAGHDDHIMEEEDEVFESLIDEGWRDFLGVEKGDVVQQREEEFNNIMNQAEAKGFKVNREVLTQKARDNKFRGKLIPVKGVLIYQDGASGLGKMAAGSSGQTSGV
jgi:hypothetical protein